MEKNTRLIHNFQYVALSFTFKVPLLSQLYTLVSCQLEIFTIQMHFNSVTGYSCKYTVHRYLEYQYSMKSWNSLHEYNL